MTDWSFQKEVFSTIKDGCYRCVMVMWPVWWNDIIEKTACNFNIDCNVNTTIIYSVQYVMDCGQLCRSCSNPYQLLISVSWKISIWQQSTKFNDKLRPQAFEGCFGRWDWQFHQTTWPSELGSVNIEQQFLRVSHSYTDTFKAKQKNSLRGKNP